MSTTKARGAGAVSRRIWRGFLPRLLHRRSSHIVNIAVFLQAAKSTDRIWRSAKTGEVFRIFFLHFLFV